MLVDCLARQSVTLANLGRVPQAARCGRRALAMARELGYRSGQVHATTRLVIAALYAGDLDDAARLGRQAGQIPDIPGTAARMCGHLLAAALAEAGDLAAADQACTATLARARDAGDMHGLGELLPMMADLDLRACRTGDAVARLREAAQIGLRTGTWSAILNVLYLCGYLCAATGGPPTPSRHGPPMKRSASKAGWCGMTRRRGAGRMPCARPGRSSARTGPARPGSAARQ